MISPARIAPSVALPLVGVVLAAALGVSAVFSPAAVALALAGICALGFILLARHKPAASLGVLIMLLTFVPASGLPLRSATHPVVLLGALLLGLSACRYAFVARKVSLGAIDAAVMLLAVGLVLAWITGGQPTIAFAAAIGVWIVPYLVGRMISRAGHAETLGYLIILGALLLVPFALLEAYSHHNLFFDIFTYVQPLESETLNKFERLGQLRVRTTWRHPILFAIFLCTASGLSATMALKSIGRRRWALVAAAIVLAATQVLTISRTGWLMLAVVAIVVACTQGTRLVSRRNRMLFALGLVALLVVASLPQTQALFGGSDAGQAQDLRTSSEYRAALQREALQPGFFDPFGTSRTLLGPGGMTSIDNAYILVGWNWGYLPLLSLILAGPLVLRQAFRNRRNLVAVAFCAVASAQLVAIYSVALFGQMQILFFLTLGVVGGLTTDRVAMRQAVRPARRRIDSDRGPTPNAQSR